MHATGDDDDDDDDAIEVYLLRRQQRKLYLRATAVGLFNKQNARFRTRYVRSPPRARCSCSRCCTFAARSAGAFVVLLPNGLAT